MKLFIASLILMAACVGCAQNPSSQTIDSDPKVVNNVPSQAQPGCNLSAPIAQSPQGYISEEPQSFNWYSTEKEGRQYHFILRNTATGELIYEKTGHASTSLELPASIVLEKHVKYTWMVRAELGNNCVSNWSNPWDFIVYDPAFIPNPIGPQAYITNSQPEFTWTSVTSAVRYEIQVVELDNNSQIFDAMTASTEMPSPQNVTFQLNTIYIWQIRAVDAQGKVGKWSDPESFLVYDPAFAPQLTSPVGQISEPNPEFQWAPVANAQAYELEIWEGNQLVYQGASAEGSNEPSLTLVAPFQLKSGVTYNWRVRTINTLVQVSDWSEPVSFVIGN